ncbi:MAG: alpha/beta hydrolase [Solirubrobacteraceae bacterium]|nr:alpha/beta hydrolase [Solirubrobacteraceae bacterium]
MSKSVKAPTPPTSARTPRLQGRAGLLAWRQARRRARRADPAPLTVPPLTAVTERLVHTSSGPVRVREAGSGPTLLFVHGLLVDGRVWDATAAELTGSFRCVIPDLPLGSHRHPMHADADFTPQGVAALLEELAQLLELGDVTVVANDSGGAITQLWMAAGAPRVSRVVLATVDAFDNFPPAAFTIYPKLAATSFGLSAALNLSRVRSMRHGPIAYGGLTHRPIDDRLARSWGGAALVDAGVRRDLRAFLRGLDSQALVKAQPEIAAFDRPVLLAWAPEQRWFPIEHADRLASLLPDARIVEIPSSGAFPQLDQPVALAAAVADFAESRRA